MRAYAGKVFFFPFWCSFFVTFSLSRCFSYFSETALKLDTLVGDIEDAVMSSLNKNLRTSRSSGFEVRTLSSARVFCIKV